MAKILKDNRKYISMTEAEADELFSRIASLELEITKITAAFDKRIDPLKCQCQEQTKELKEQLEEKSKELAEYIEAHKDRFQKPRSRKTSQGKYGLRNVSNVKIEDEGKIIAHSDENGLELYKTIQKVDKAAVRAALESGSVDGAKLETGEETFFKVEKSLLDEARKNVLSN